MSTDPTPSTPMSPTGRNLGRNSPPADPPSAVRLFLDRRPALLLALSAAVGLACGALAVLVDGLSSDGLPFLEWSVGLYVAPPVLLGWSAVRPWAATAAGSLAYLSAVLAHLATAHLTVDDYNLLEYRVWVPLGFAMGALLGFAGNGFHSRSTTVRVFAAGLPLGLLAVFLWVSVQAQADSGGTAVHPGALLLDGILALGLLALCRGWATRFKALLCAAALGLPLAFGQFCLFVLVWWASGDH
ncbi:DUF6518 family protein [Nocardiopsis tropica]|uniref:DUF6518 family protein n=1 Tax=Nocardiopsis tropica TaxID=109330 RepID=UPI0031D80861